MVPQTSQFGHRSPKHTSQFLSSIDQDIFKDPNISIGGGDAVNVKPSLNKSNQREVWSKTETCCGIKFLAFHWSKRKWRKHNPNPLITPQCCIHLEIWRYVMEPPIRPQRSKEFNSGMLNYGIFAKSRDIPVFFYMVSALYLYFTFGTLALFSWASWSPVHVRRK